MTRSSADDRAPADREVLPRQVDASQLQRVFPLESTPVATQTVPFGTEAGHYQAAGIPTVVCGPGSIDQAHQPDEYITLDQIEAGAAFMRRLAATCASS